MVRPYEKEFYEHLYPYPINYHKENEVTTDVLVIGGGPAGCAAAIAAAKKGVRVALVEKSATIRTGGGATGCDHWANATTNPCSKVTPEEIAHRTVEYQHGYGNGIGRYITCRDSWDCLLEVEKMGVKVRDTDDEFKGSEFRDEKTKLLFAMDLKNKTYIRFWGSGAQPAFVKELKRLGVEIYNRVAATSLLTEGGKPGTRVIGATGVNVRTAEFMVFKAKAVVLCTSHPSRLSTFSQELGGPSTCVGTGHVMGWKAGAEFTLFESTRSSRGGGWPPNGQGIWHSSWDPCSMVDANGKEIPWADIDGRILKTISERSYPAPGQKLFGYQMAGDDPSKSSLLPPTLGGSGMGGADGPSLIPDLDKRVDSGEYVLPLYADLPGMPEDWRRVIWDVMLAQEGHSRIGYRYNFGKNGFDPNKDMLQLYLGPTVGGEWFGWTGMAQCREFAIPEGGGSGGFVVDWDLKTNVKGLYIGGQAMFAANTYSNAVTTGRWAGRHAGDYARKADKPVIDRHQVEEEKSRVIAPLKREKGMEWKAFNSEICRVMQYYCGVKKGGELLNIALTFMKELHESEAQKLFAREPHELMRVLEALDILTVDEMVVHACMARKASSFGLDFIRRDYPQMDPPEWDKFLTIRRANGEVKVGELPKNYWGDFIKGYEAHNSPEK